MREVLPRVWQTRTDTPFPGLTTHAYLWTGGRSNVLFYSPAGDADLDEIERLGGVAHQYLSHRDEAGPVLAVIGRRFGARLHAPAAERAEIEVHRRIDVALTGRHVDANGIEVVPTPGHTPGSMCYLVPGGAGARYLFTGDTLYVGPDGRWTAGYLPFSDAAALAASLRLLAELRPDVVISSAFTGDTAVHPVDRRRWPEHIAEALDGLAQRV
ncbi:MBL fold metallo-hydrolase [uncultured Mycolicibacterium sp.]|uniref:MBL fold metallo-hydrolase n=1 Tax=uncultured Mycolicibacterium sp. TaxID=2320817 RepID=UPI002606F534|nr:MBL fold metallo-hydrolase [uncultured Mycolicibacterium sp.]